MKLGKTKSPRQTDAPESITCRTILVIDDRPLNPENTANRVIIRVCQWTRQEEPVLEVRRCYRKKDGEEKWDKLRGWTIDDLRIVAEHQPEIIAALQV